MAQAHTHLTYVCAGRHRYQIDIEPHCRTYPPADTLERAAESLRFVPLLQWYDSTHLCSTHHYRSFVFGRRNGKRLVAKGGFIEDKLSQQQLAEVRIFSHASAVSHPCTHQSIPVGGVIAECVVSGVSAVLTDTRGWR
jgi:hypothetical protein